MKQKKNKIALIAVLAILLASTTGLLLYVFNRENARKEALKEGNVAGIEWYDVNGKEFTISTVDQLYELVELSNFYDFKGQTIKLDADIVVNEGNAEKWKTEAPEKKWFPIRRFAGTFDGQGHTISGLYNSVADISMAMFANTNESAVIQDFKLVNSYFHTWGNKGTASISSDGGGTFKRIYSDAILDCEDGFCGGLLSRVQFQNASLEECWFDGTIYTKARVVGGLVDELKKADMTISHCLNSGDINNTHTANGAKVGGILANSNQWFNQKLIIEDCLNVGQLTTKNMFYVGSVLGCITKNTEVKFENIFASYEAYDTAVGRYGDQGTFTGAVLRVENDKLTGQGGYEWTNLDFEKYWTITDEGTPILKYFAEEIQSVAGLNKKFNVDWYNSEKKEFVLKTVEDFYGFSLLSRYTNFKEKTVKLGANISLNKGNATSWAKKAPANVWIPIGTFSGTFDGQMHTISGVYVKGEHTLGLFTRTTALSTIKNFYLKNSYFYASGSDETKASFVGSIVGRGCGVIDTVYSNAIVSGGKVGVGGFIGQMNTDGKDNRITNCWFDGTVNMVKEDAIRGGGFIGTVVLGTVTIEHCLNSGAINSEVKNKGAQIGGVVGHIQYNDAKVVTKDVLSVGTVNTKNQFLVGSILGTVTKENAITFNDTYASLGSYDVLIGRYGDEGSITGTPLAVVSDKLIGNKAYQWTTLNFSKYWAVVREGTPVLRSFAKSVPSVAGLKKMVDVSWYDSSKNTYTITSREQLNGLSMLSVSTDFEGKKIKLGADIVMNKGNAEDWAENAPELNWMPISNFAGTFDGKGHTISGIYSSGESTVGLFARTTKDSVIKNLRLENSYFCATGTEESNASFVGSIVARGGGVFDTIYSDAIVCGERSVVGGFIGQANADGSDNRITNCWFNGTVNMLTDNAIRGGGFIGSVVNGKVTIEHCLNAGTINSEVASKGAQVGGIVGHIEYNDATVEMKDVLSAGKINTKNQFLVGSVVGTVTKDCTLSMEDVYAATETYKRPIGEYGNNGTIQGAAKQVDKVNLKGYYGYQFTMLDFKKYWAVDLDDVPVLQSFADDIPSLSGVTKIHDTSWYDEKDDKYYISTKEQLYGLAKLSENTDFAGKTIYLTKDIEINSGNASEWGENPADLKWTPISTFAGTFDGQGHTISGLYVNTTSQYTGLFSIVKGTIQNVGLENSYIYSTLDRTGAFAGEVAGATFKNVYSDAIVTSEKGVVGGLVGRTVTANCLFEECWFDGQVNSSNLGTGGIVGGLLMHATLKNCLNTGTITSSCNDSTHGSWTGGLVGYNMNGAILTATNCMSVGDIEVAEGAVKYGSVIGGSNTTGGAKVTNVYVSTSSCDTTHGGVAPTGEIAKLPKASLIGTKAYVNTLLDFESIWVARKNDWAALKNWVAEKDIADISGEARPNTSWFDKDATESVIKNKADLLGFAQLAAKGQTFEGKVIKLGADITLNSDMSKPDTIWTPIEKFAGTFDGQGYSINGLYVESTASCAGFISYLTGTVQNLAIKDSTITTTSNIAGSFAGRGQGATFKNLYTNATVSATGGIVGGIVGQLNTEAGCTLVECWFDGTVKSDGLGTGGIIGGIIFNTTTMTNCLNSGVIQSTYNDGWVGGLCGYTNMSGVLNVTNCMSIEDITVPSGAGNTGSVVGYNNKTNATNVYVYAKNGAVTTGDKNVTGITYLTSAPNTEQLKGKAVYSSTNLDYFDIWAARTDKAPALKYWLKKFGDTSVITPTNADLSAIADTSWYTTASSGVTFVLQDVADLYGFAKLINTAKTEFTGQTIKLGKDLVVNSGNASSWKNEAPVYSWTPIGSLTSSRKFNGTFDGDGHSISGLYFISNEQGLGLFGWTGAGSVIQNVKLDNTYFCATFSTAPANHLGGAQLGAIAGRSLGDITNVYVTDRVYLDCYGYYCGGIAGLNVFGANKTYSNCWFDGHIDMKTTGRAGGGIIGIIKSDASSMTLSNCLFSGTITTSYSAGGVQIGGLVGFTEVNMNVSDCLVTGTVTSTAIKTVCGAVFGYTTSGKTIMLTDVYEDDDTASYTIGQYGDNATKSGQIQTISHANLLGNKAKTNASGLFTGNGSIWVTVTNATPELRYWSTSSSAIENPVLVPDTTWHTTTVAGTTFVLTTKEQLYGFAQLVNGGTNFAGQTVKLGADITVNTGDASTWATLTPDYEWTPIGSLTGTLDSGKNQRFDGVFDGDGHSISGLYFSRADQGLGLFGWTGADSVVKNLKLENTYFCATNSVAASNHLGGAQLGAISGRSFGSIQNVYVTDSVYLDCYGYYCGGIAGYNPLGANKTYSSCWFAGHIDMKSTGRAGGGIIGAVQADTFTLKDCLFTGTLTTANSSVGPQVGGLIGNAGASVNLTDCLSCGKVTSTGSQNTVGAVLGYTTSGKTITLADVYEDDDTASRTIGQYGDNATKSGQIQTISHSNLLGDKAKTYAAGLFTNNGDTWKTVSGSTPELKQN